MTDRTTDNGDPRPSAISQRWVKPLSFGPVTIDFPAVLAALSGYSDWPMRVIARRLGAPFASCEVMLDQFLLQLRQRQRTRHFLYFDDEDRPIAGQLMGAEPTDFARGAVRLVEAGFDVIDINFGCPVRKVLGKCRGGYHLSQPAVAIEIIRRVRDAVPEPIPVTVKMRRGMDDSSASQDNFFTILDGAFSAGLAAATIHGRTVVQRYTGTSDWQFLTAVKSRYPDRVILGSGDLFSATDCVRMLEQTKVDGVSVARGAIGNPWLFRQLRQLAAGDPAARPDLFEQASVMRTHYGLAEQLYGADRCAPLMRKFGIKYAQLHPQAELVRNDFVRVRSKADWLGVLDRWYLTRFTTRHRDRRD